MKLIDRILAKFRKKEPEKPPVQPIPGYGYWDYRRDLFDAKLSFDEIMGRAGGTIPKPPRYPKRTEGWVWRQCSKHGIPQGTYPLLVYISEKELKVNLWPFLFCGCLIHSDLHKGNVCYGSPETGP
jgi:hypothetical protein